MEQVNLSSTNNIHNTTKMKKSNNFAKMRFTDLNNKIEKKTAQDSLKINEKIDTTENEKSKKLNHEKQIYQIESDLDNKQLLLKVIDTHSVLDHLDDYFTKEGNKTFEDDKIQNEYNDDPNKNKQFENLDEFWKKYRNFNDTIRKGKVKLSTPAYGFIKSCQENSLIPNPVGFVNRINETDAVVLK